MQHLLHNYQTPPQFADLYQHPDYLTAVKRFPRLGEIDKATLEALANYLELTTQYPTLRSHPLLSYAIKEYFSTVWIVGLLAFCVVEKPTRHLRLLCHRRDRKTNALPGGFGMFGGHIDLSDVLHTLLKGTSKKELMRQAARFALQREIDEEIKDFPEQATLDKDLMDMTYGVPLSMNGPDNRSQKRFIHALAKPLPLQRLHVTEGSGMAFLSQEQLVHLQTPYRARKATFASPRNLMIMKEYLPWIEKLFSPTDHIERHLSQR